MPITNEAAVEILREDLAAEERSAAHYRKHAKFPGDALAAEEHERHAEALRAAIAALERKPVGYTCRPIAWEALGRPCDVVTKITRHPQSEHGFTFPLYANPEEQQP